MKITIEMIKELREETSFMGYRAYGIQACKEALVECGGDFKDAKVYLREHYSRARA